MATRGVPPTVKAKGVAIRYLSLRHAVVPFWIAGAPVVVSRGVVVGGGGLPLSSTALRYAIPFTGGYELLMHIE